MNRTRLTLAAVAAAVAAALTLGGPQAAAGPAAKPLPPRTGMNMHHLYLLPRFDEQAKAAVRRMRDAGIQRVSMILKHYQRSLTSPWFVPRNWDERFQVLGQFVDYIHQQGMTAEVKCYIEVPGEWRAEIKLADDDEWAIWWRNYGSFVTTAARWCQDKGIASLCVGTELRSTEKMDKQWRALIAQVRAVYKGEVLYAANWDDVEHVTWWDALDAIGADAYFPLSQKDNPTVDDLVAGWSRWKWQLEQLADVYGKPVVFTEIGYTTMARTHAEPWTEHWRRRGEPGQTDQEAQAKCYEAFYKAFGDPEETPWFRGFYWWATTPHSDGESRHGGRSPFGKKAEDALKSGNAEWTRLRK